MRAGSLLLLFALLGTAAHAGVIATDDLSVGGTVVANTLSDSDGNDVVLVTMPGQSLATVTPQTDSVGADRYLQYWSPVLSPDGSRIAFVRAERFRAGGLGKPAVYVMNNDGTGAVKVCDFAWIRPVLKSQSFLTWTMDGYLYWSEDTAFVYRVPVQGGTPEVKCEFHPPADMPQDTNSRGNVYFLSVSSDGRRAVSESSGGGRVYHYDLTGCMRLLSVDGGCRGTISPDGDYVAHTYAGYPVANQTAYIRRFADGSIAATITAPGVLPDSISDNNFADLRFAHSSRNHVVCMGDGALRGTAYLYDVWSNSYAELGHDVEPWDFREGALPPPATTPVLSLDTVALYFGPADLATPQCVTVAASLPLQDSCVLTMADSSAWLKVSATHATTGCTLCNTIDTTGLDPLAYFETVTVGSPSAANTVSYRVILNNGVSIVRPTGLRVTQIAGSTVLVEWHDNADNEEHFLVQRRGETGGWQTAGVVPANTTWSRDSLPQLGGYWYRVAAYNASDTSLYSGSAYIGTRVYPTLTVLSPLAGDSLLAGSNVHLTWRARYVTIVVITYTFDGGETWLDLGKTDSTEANFGDYPWYVPDTVADSVWVRFETYDGEFLARTGPLALVDAGGVRPAAAVGRHAAGPCITKLMWHGGGRPWNAVARGSVIAVYALDGTRRLTVGGGRGGLPSTMPPGCYIVTVPREP
jgi:hypothetical protein